MAQNQFFTRVMNWLVNEVVVHRLANSALFQRFAVRTAQTIETAKAHGTSVMRGEKAAADVMSEVGGKNAAKAAEAVKGGASKVQGNAQRFASILTDQIKKDLFKTK